MSLPNVPPLIVFLRAKRGVMKVLFEESHLLEKCPDDRAGASATVFTTASQYWIFVETACSCLRSYFSTAASSSALLKGPWNGPRSVLASSASMARRPEAEHSSGAPGSLGRMVITPPEAISNSCPLLNPAFLRTAVGTTSGVLLLFLTAMVMIVVRLVSI